MRRLPVPMQGKGKQQSCKLQYALERDAIQD